MAKGIEREMKKFLFVIFSVPLTTAVWTATHAYAQTNSNQVNSTTNSNLDLSECERSHGTPGDGVCGCDRNKYLETTTQSYNGTQYSICKCIGGYKRANGNYKDECVPANDISTEKVLDTAKMRETAEKAYQDAKSHEQTLANKGLTAATTAATGLGTMTAASAYLEQRADADAEKDMRNYLATFKCEYGNGNALNAGNEEITLPGGNELLEYYTEYKTLADSVKQKKTALGLRAGIESETLYDRAQSGLYQYTTTERVSGGEISLSRALSDETSADAAAWNAQKSETQSKLYTGAAVAVIGAAAGLVGNYLINKNQKTQLQQKLDKEIEEILPSFEYDQNRENIDIQPIESKLNTQGLRSNMPTVTNLSIPTFPITGEKFENNQDTLKQTDDLDLYINKINTVMEYSRSLNTQKLHFYITGHTDRTGTQRYNQDLSQRRANTVKNYLSKNLIIPDYFTVEYTTAGKGFSECAENGSQPDCRRVDIKVIDETIE